MMVHLGEGYMLSSLHLLPLLTSALLLVKETLQNIITDNLPPQIHHLPQLRLISLRPVKCINFLTFFIKFSLEVSAYKIY